MRISRPLWIPVLLFLVSAFLLIIGCEKDTGSEFSADFSYEFMDDNHVRFTNQSEGEYFSLFWDFGNGDTVSTTNKNRSFEIYYPEAGSYQVSLTVYNYTGQTRTATETISITSDDLVVSFNAKVDPENPNYVILENTSTGNYDSLRWEYRNQEIENQQDHTAWLPFSGQYTLKLVVFKNGEPFTSTKTVTISQDDPDYVDNLQLTWEEEFDGTAVNTDNWTFDTGATGWGNNELQNYTNGENVEVTNGKLIITARKVDDEKQPGSYTSSRLKTANKKEFAYGRMEVRAKLPSGKGIWPAIWMLGSNFPTAGWPECGEIDIMEYVGYQPNTVHSTIHTPSSYGNSVNGTSVTLETAEEAFHNYGIIRTEKYIRFYIDTPDNITYTYAPSSKNEDNWPFDQPFFFILNMAVGGNWGGAQGIDNSIFPQKMEIEYVRVYQENP